MSARIPVTLITGFLGAGKTTLLNRLLKDPDLADTAVVINEFGDVGLDHLLVEHAEDGVVLLAAGCLCCTIRGELASTLEDLAARRDAGTLPPFRRLIIETTGLADPAPILQTLIAHPGIAARYGLDAVVTVVDAVNGEATLDAHPESVKQAAVADRIVLAKTDIASVSALAQLEGRLVGLNPGAGLFDVARGEATVAKLLGGGLFNIADKSADVRGWLKSEAYSAAHDHHGRHHGPGAHQHAHEPNRHDGHIRAFTLTTERALSPSLFETFLGLVRERHGPDLLRLKALVKLSDDPERPVVVHGVQHILHPPIRLPRWPDADRRTRAVFIVRDIDPAVIEGLFASLTGEPRIDAPDAAVLADNPLALR